MNPIVSIENQENGTDLKTPKQSIITPIAKENAGTKVESANT
jgi:hypothetical protein